MDDRMLDLYGEFRRGLIDRRGFLQAAVVVTGSLAASQALFSVLEAGEARAEVIAEDDSRLAAETITFPSPAGDMNGYFVRPQGDAKLPGVVVIHENRGLNAHIRDVARRVAVEGFLALAPDALTSKGGTPGEDQAKAIDMIKQLDARKTMWNFKAAAQYLRTRPDSTGKVAVMGFCWGGGMTNQVAVNDPELNAGVPYYGSPPNPADVSKIKASMLLHYAGEDERINQAVPDFEKALKAAGVEYQLHMYPGAQHAFNNDTNADRYNKEAADLAWKRTMEFLAAKLKS